MIQKSFVANKEISNREQFILAAKWKQKYKSNGSNKKNLVNRIVVDHRMNPINYPILFY